MEPIVMSVTPSDFQQTSSVRRPGVETNKGVSTTSVHAGEARQKPSHAITDSVVLASTFTFENTQSIIDFIENDEQRGEYGRYGVPGEHVVEAKLAALEGAEDAILYSSGMAAFVGVLNSVLSQGDEIIFFDECYHRSREYCRKHLSRFGVKTIDVKTGDYDAMEAAITPNTKLLVSESPTNPHLSIVDLDRFAEIGKQHNVLTIIDATLATPFNIQPIAHGVDLVMHSATKYLGGHNDLLAGVVLGKKEVLDPIRTLRGIICCNAV
jgi:cystathionine gamma-synthase